MHYFNELIAILNEMSPYLILGFLISGLLHVYVPRSLYSRFLQRRGFRSVVGAALLGIPLPLCSCGVIPTAMSLKKEGASDGATVSFLVATPQTGVDSILATYSLLGLAFAIIRPIAALVVAIFGGVLVDGFEGFRGVEGKPKKLDPSKFSYVPQEQAHGHTHNCSCGCSHNSHEGHDSHSSHSSRGSKPEKSLKAALRYGFVEIMQDFGKWLVVGLLIAAAITAFVPDSVFAMFKEHYMLNLLLILIVSAPMYICATGSIPIALSLILKGISPGAAFVLLMAGPATNMASLIILRRGIGMRKTIIYLVSIIVGAIVCALVIDFVLPQEWFSSLHHIVEHTHEHHHEHDHSAHGPIWWQTTTSILFIVLFINSIIRGHKHSHDCSCSH